MSFESLIYLSFIAPSLAALIVFVFGKKRFIKEIISTFSITLAMLSTILCSGFINQSNKTILLHIFYIDGFSILMQLMVELVAFVVILYSIVYIPKIYSHRKQKFHVYYSIILLATGFMNLAFVMNNFFWLYIALELSSILVVYVIVFNLNKESLKAGFKYLILINVGILFSLLGIILLFYVTKNPIMISNFGQVIKSLPTNIGLLSACLFIIGFFTKAGLIPFHLWLSDSYAESPSPVTVFLSGAVTKLGFYGLVRTVTIFSFHYEEIRLLVITLASLSMLFGAIIAFNQRDIKKLIAYISISEMGFIASALVLKTYEGIFGGVFHLINHTLMKGVLFFAVGAIIYICGSRDIDEIKKIIIKIPVISISFFVGALSVGGMPLFASFLSSITIFFALINEGFLLTAILLIFAEFLSAVILLKTAISIFWQRQEKIAYDVSLPFLMVFCIGFFTILVIVFGIYPEAIYPIIDIAAKGIIKID